MTHSTDVEVSNKWDKDKIVGVPRLAFINLWGFLRVGGFLVQLASLGFLVSSVKWEMLDEIKNVCFILRDSTDYAGQGCLEGLYWEGFWGWILDLLKSTHSQLIVEAQEGRGGTCIPMASVVHCSLTSMRLIMAETSRTATANMFSWGWPQRFDSWSQSITSESLSLAVLTSKIPSCLPCWCLEILSRFFIFFLVCVYACMCMC